MPQASSLAAEIANVFGFEPELIPGSAGVFDVQANEQVVFSKHSEGRFPEHAEVIDSLKQVQAAN